MEGLLILHAAATFAMTDHPHKVVPTVDAGATFAEGFLSKLATSTSVAAFRTQLAEAAKLAGIEELD